MVRLDDFRRLAGLTDARVLGEVVRVTPEELRRVAETVRKRLGSKSLQCVMHADLLTTELLAAGFKGVTHVAGYVEVDGNWRDDWGSGPVDWYRDDPETIDRDMDHHWVEVGDFIVDTSADQFNALIDGKGFPPVFVARKAQARRHHHRLSESVDDEKSIHATLMAAIVANDKTAEATVKAWTKAAPKRTCPRCKGSGFFGGAVTMYAGAPGGCYECGRKGIVPKHPKAAKAVTTEAELTRLRSNWKAYKAAATAMAAAAAAAQTPSAKREAEWRLKDYERMLKSIAELGQYTKGGG